jgi:hypothetical protein
MVFHFLEKVKGNSRFKLGVSIIDPTRRVNLTRSESDPKTWKRKKKGKASDAGTSTSQSTSMRLRQARGIGL